MRVACFYQFCKKPNKLAQNYGEVNFQWKHLFNCSQLGAIQRHFGHSEWKVYFPGPRRAFAKQTSKIATTKKAVNETNKTFPWLYRFECNSNKQVSHQWSAEDFILQISHDWKCQRDIISSEIQNTQLQKYSFHFADLPDEGPVISGSQPRYHTGDILTANCSSSRSLPAASLKWANSIS